MKEHTMDKSHNEALEQRRRIRNSAVLFGGIAFLFYVGFIALSAMRG